MSVRVKMRERAKVRMKIRDGKAAAKIGAKTAADLFLANVAKVGAAKAGEKKTEARESRERLKGQAKKKERERRA